jgi:hypothetical protein
MTTLTSPEGLQHPIEVLLIEDDPEYRSLIETWRAEPEILHAVMRRALAARAHARAQMRVRRRDRARAI